MGLFGAPVTWSLFRFTAILLPDGRMMSYGTNAQGKQAHS